MGQGDGSFSCVCPFFEEKIVKRLMLATAILFSAPCVAEATPPALPLDKAIRQADIVVVGTLGKLTEEPKPERGVQRATGAITVTQVLKAGDSLPEELKTVILQTHGGPVLGPPGYKEGASGIWILTRIKGSDAYRGANPTSLQPIENLDKVKAEIENQNE
jgi:hypothetical protein